MGARLVLDAAEVEGGGEGGLFSNSLTVNQTALFFSSSNSEGKSKDYHASEEAAARTRDAEARRRNLPTALLNFPAESEATAAEVAAPLSPPPLFSSSSSSSERSSSRKSSRESASARLRPRRLRARRASRPLRRRPRATAPAAAEVPPSPSPRGREAWPR